MKLFKRLSEKGYKHYTGNTIEELDELPLDSPDIITEFAHLKEWLRINHGIHIEILLTEDAPYDTFYYRVLKIGQYFTLSHDGIYKNTPQESYNEAFDYILKELL